MEKELYVEIESKSKRYLSGVYKVVEIIGSIIAVDIDGTTVDFYIGGVGEVKKFCRNKEGDNFVKNFR